MNAFCDEFAQKKKEKVAENARKCQFSFAFKVRSTKNLDFWAKN